MSRFVQLHLLTNYAPSNLNREDTGRPKSALVGDALRLRISSQCQKRAWRTSDAFAGALAGHLGTRTKRLGNESFDALRKAGVREDDARKWSRAIAGCFGKPKAENRTDNQEDLEIEQLAHVSTHERQAVRDLVEKCAQRGSAPEQEELLLLRKPRHDVDIAMFGRMLADSPQFNVDAAIQVAHAITVHRCTVEDDYFTAIDDLNRDAPEASHIGERGYGAGLFYQYLCINRELLLENLGGDGDLTARALAALMHAVTKVSPNGMQNSFASRAYASYVLAEKGDQQPRSLAEAFLKPIKPGNDRGMLELAIAELEKRQKAFDQVYGVCADQRYTINVPKGEGQLTALIAFVQATP